MKFVNYNVSTDGVYTSGKILRSGRSWDQIFKAKRGSYRCKPERAAIEALTRGDYKFKNSIAHIHRGVKKVDQTRDIGGARLPYEKPDMEKVWRVNQDPNASIQDVAAMYMEQDRMCGHLLQGRPQSFAKKMVEDSDFQSWKYPEAGIDMQGGLSTWKDMFQKRDGLNLQELLFDPKRQGPTRPMRDTISFSML
mmetsp:Transcript_39998/g.103311  ORF Transcript_39998/g.103311 Transcript_39998/m.103311 type:complete len:194 (-) Transcript_39998:2339-2920(-)